MKRFGFLIGVASVVLTSPAGATISYPPAVHCSTCRPCVETSIGPTGQKYCSQCMDPREYGRRIPIYCRTDPHKRFPF